MRRFMGLAPALLLSGCIVREHTEHVAARDPLSAEAIVASLAGGAGEEDVALRLQEHGVLRAATTDDVIALKRAGVSDALVVDFLGAQVTTPRDACVIVHRWYAVDWDAIGGVTYGVLRVLVEAAVQCCTCVFRGR